MSNYTNRVIFPGFRTPLYISDDTAGYSRMVEVYREHGNLQVQYCEKVPGLSLQELPVADETTICETLGIDY